MTDTGSLVGESPEVSFEGPEKLLELWFHPSAAAAVSHLLRFRRRHRAEAHYDSNVIFTAGAAGRVVHNSVSALDASDGDGDAWPGRSSSVTPSFDTYPRRAMKQSSRDFGLRCVAREVWKDVLTQVRCQILSSIHNDHVDAYLLSESSMFIYPHKLILKTCGTTTLLAALPRILEISRDYCGFHRVWRVFYSRKSFMFPEMQSHPHKSWKDEVAFLDNLFKKGSAYVVGPVNGGHWNLYLSAPAEDILRYPMIVEQERADSSPSSPDVEFRSEASESTLLTEDELEEDRTFHQQQCQQTLEQEEDQTIEILMTDLCPAAMRAFYRAHGEPDGLEGGRRVEHDSGLSMAFHPASFTDSFLFTPCGYSMNGLLGDRYITVHVTPEPSCSYASFETTLPLDGTAGIATGAGGDASLIGPLTRLMRRVVDVFRPGKFSVTVFNSAPQGPPASKVLGDLSGYTRADRIHYEFDGYDMVFAHYEKDTA